MTSILQVTKLAIAISPPGATYQEFMKVRLYQDDGSFTEHTLLAVNKFPAAVLHEGYFYLHSAVGYYWLVEYYSINIPPAAIEIQVEPS
ncbi:hypothetical protein [Cylindrospermum sp. FACHB-282]|uniref:hypothetical protein n=1 Tax=Cylindrospermum sp. FACHB-282 TaxID=2692794 RepID=UPI001683AB6E|nr:hypothetical protein [Cylindrospermum sp. FACHB-282]MBD2388809.1 hypothetical protein [Cylindrospermum sp. FACHB-282]